MMGEALVALCGCVAKVVSLASHQTSSAALYCSWLIRLNYNVTHSNPTVIQIEIWIVHRHNLDLEYWPCFLEFCSNSCWVPLLLVGLVPWRVSVHLLPNGWKFLGNCRYWWLETQSSSFSFLFLVFFLLFWIEYLIGYWSNNGYCGRLYCRQWLANNQRIIFNNSISNNC